MVTDAVGDPFRNLMEQAPIPTLVIRAGTEEIQFVNQAFRNVIGYSVDDIPTLDDWWPRAYPDPEYRAHVRRMWKQRLGRALEETTAPLNPAEALIRCKDGFDRTFERQAAVSGGDVVVFFVDVTDRERARQTLAATVDEVTRSNVELERFAYMASHDLKEPIRTIVGYAQLLERRLGAGLDEDSREFLGFVTDSAKRMQVLVDDLLSWSRLSSRNRPFEAVDVAGVVSAACDNLHETIARSGAVVDAADMPVVQGDAIQLVVLFQNLIANGIKYHDSADPPHIRIWSEPDGDGGWAFSVRDNGIGIDPEFHARIFDIFQRLHTAREYPGTGIGLAVCKKIVEHHGGRITIDSAPREGSTFTFTVPGGEADG